MSPSRFVALPMSPWSERARFALDHHGIDYREDAYVPLLGELALRVRTGVYRGRLSVPVLFHEGHVIRDSVEIARYVDRLGKGTPLFPAGAEAEIARYVELTNTLMEAGRVLGVPRMAQSAEARNESLPSFMPAPLRSALSPLAGMGMAYIARKYGLSEQAPQEARDTMRRILEQLRAGLKGRSTLLSDFTFADITTAVAMGAVRPVEHPALPLGPGMRAAFTEPLLVEEFGDLLAWRDRLYAERRPTRGSPRPAVTAAG
ncbi:glutathione S-transferase family protein [Cystobacter fuscus]|uniref:glutathione S-transferase family protein n=1 Tax=Cystobacter fuscus TaxID=43 RepID=UPI0037BF9AB5